MACDTPIDMVFTYVAGNDPAHREKRRRFEQLCPECDIRRDTPADRDLDVRYVDAGEIAFSVQSVAKYLPWVRTIFIVTDSQIPRVPDELIANGRVKVVDHTELIPEQYLPTFSSRVVESCLHRIPGLSDTFLYNNDDYMHFSAVPRSAFCRTNPDGRVLLTLHSNPAVAHRLLHMLSRVCPQGARIANLHVVGISNAYALLRRCRYRVPACRIIVPRHSTQVIRKATAERLDAEFGDALDANRRLKFRCVQSFSYATLLYTMEKQWNPEDRVHRTLRWSVSHEFRMFDFTGLLVRGNTERLWDEISRSTVPFACLNNLPPDERARLVEVMTQKGLQVPLHQGGRGQHG